MNISAVILAAGRGKRMNVSMNKQFLRVKEKPILSYTIEAFTRFEEIKEIILVVHKDEVVTMKEEIINLFLNDIKIPIKLVVGGQERYDSVYSGLKAVNKAAECVMIHDGARPLVTYEEIYNSIYCLKTEQACVLGVKAKNTYKLVDNNGYVLKTLERDNLYSILTPQSFHKEVILEAYEKGILMAEGITDDGMMVEKFTKYPVKILEGSYENIKITTPEDIHLMENILDSRGFRKL